jgi:hypothetical protein
MPIGWLLAKIPHLTQMATPINLAAQSGEPHWRVRILQA